MFSEKISVYLPPTMSYARGSPPMRSTGGKERGKSANRLRSVSDLWRAIQCVFLGTCHSFSLLIRLRGAALNCISCVGTSRNSHRERAENQLQQFTYLIVRAKQAVIRQIRNRHESWRSILEWGEVAAFIDSGTAAH